MLKDSYNAGTLSNQTLGSHFSSQQHLLNTLSDTLGRTQRRSINRNISKNNILFSDEKFSSESKTQTGFYSTVKKDSRINSKVNLKPRETEVSSPRMVANSTSKNSKFPVKHSSVRIMSSTLNGNSNLGLRQVETKTKAIWKTSKVNTLVQTRK